MVLFPHSSEYPLQNMFLEIPAGKYLDYIYEEEIVKPQSSFPLLS